MREIINLDPQGTSQGLLIEISKPHWECGNVDDGVLFYFSESSGGFVVSFSKLKEAVNKIALLDNPTPHKRGD